MKFKLDIRLSTFNLTSILYRLLRETNVRCMIPREGENLEDFWAAAEAQEDSNMEEAGEQAGTWLGIDHQGDNVVLGWRGQFTEGRWLSVAFQPWARATYRVAGCPDLDVTIECSLGGNETRHPGESKFFRIVLGEYAEQMKEALPAPPPRRMAKVELLGFTERDSLDRDENGPCLYQIDENFLVDMEDEIRHDGESVLHWEGKVFRITKI